MFEILKKNKINNKIDTSGFHIHFNRTFLKNEEETKRIKKIILMVDQFRTSIINFTGRDWAKIKPYYMKKIVNIDEHIKLTNKIGRGNFLEKFYEIALNNEKTIEFRMFKSTLCLKKFMNTLRLVYSIVMFANSKIALTNLKFDDLLPWHGILMADFLKDLEGLNIKQLRTIRTAA